MVIKFLSLLVPLLCMPLFTEQLALAFSIEESLDEDGESPDVVEQSDPDTVGDITEEDTRSEGLPAETFDAAVDMSNIPYAPKPGNDVQVFDLFTNVAHARGKTWFITRDPSDGRPYVWQKADNATGDTRALRYPIDNLSPTYYAWNDQHHAWSIGVDSLGYLHVMGDMHYYPYGPNPGSACPAGSPAGPHESAINSVPARYRCQVALYWRSNRPYDASAGFTFRGDSWATAPQAIAITYPRFIHAPNGDLYFTAIGKALRDTSSSRTGQMAVILHKYDATRSAWTAVGGSVKGLVTDTPSENATTYYPAFFWDNGGHPDGNGGRHPWFQGFQHQFCFDRNGGMHFCGAINLNTNPYGSSANTRMLYAFSPDGGTTWKKANGTTITSGVSALPLRAAAGQAKMADLVLDTAPSGGWSLGDYTVVAADSDNMPACRAQLGGANNYSGRWYRWNGSAWVDDMSDDQHGGLLFHWNAIAPMGRDGMVTYLDTTSAVFRRSSNHTYASKTYSGRKLVPNLYQFRNVSDKGVWETDALYGVGYFGSPATHMQVMRVSFNPNTPYTVTERYPNLVTTNWVWDRGPINLAAGQQLTMEIVPQAGNKVQVSNEIWTAGYGAKLTTVMRPDKTSLTYKAGYPTAAARIYTGIAGVNLDVTITRPAQVEYFSYPSGKGLVLRGPFKLKAGQTLRHIVTAPSNNMHFVNNEIWDSTRTTKLGETNSQTTSTMAFTARTDTTVYTGTYIGVPQVKLSTEVHY